MIIVKAYHNKSGHDVLATGTRAELITIFDSLVKQYDNETYILINEEYTVGYCYADFAHIKKGDMYGFVIALAGDIITSLKNHKHDKED